MAKIVYASNKAAIGDGMRITRVSEGGQKLEVLVDAKTERWSEITLQGEVAEEAPAESDEDEDQPADPEPEPDPDDGGSEGAPPETDDTAEDPAPPVDTDPQPPPDPALPVGELPNPVRGYDALVHDVAALVAKVTSWAADGGSTARVIGIDAVTGGDITLVGLKASAPIYIRHVGTFGKDLTCSAYHSGTITLKDCRNIFFTRFDLRAPDAGAYNYGLAPVSGCEDCGFIDCAFTGRPFDPAGSEVGTTRYGTVLTDTVRPVLVGNAYRFMADGLCKFMGGCDAPEVRMNVGRHTCGDDFTLAGDVVMTNPLFEANFADRVHHPQPGVHQDWLQANKGATLRGTVKILFNVVMRGRWTGPGLANKTSNGYQAVFLAGCGSSGADGVITNNFLANGQKRAADRPPGSGWWHASFNAVIDSEMPADQTANARFPSITGMDEAQQNDVTVPYAGYNTQEGVGGTRILISADDHSEVLRYYHGVPSDTNDLWDCRPREGTNRHPFYAGAEPITGASGLWSGLFGRDPRILPTMRGWPSSVIFTEDFDRGDNFSGGLYTGRFDADGNLAA